MIVISPTELRSNQKKYFDLAEKEQVLIKRGSKLIELVVKQSSIADSNIEEGVSSEEVKKEVHKHIDKLFTK